MNETPDIETIILTPPNTLLRIDAVYAFVSVDADGNECLCAMTIPGLGFTPLIAADQGRLKSLWPLARDMARASRMRVRLIKLSTRTELQAIGPDGQDER